MELFFKRNKKEKENDNDRPVKCKHCDMRFEDKQRFKVHSKIAHTEEVKGKRRAMDSKIQSPKIGLSNISDR